MPYLVTKKIMIAQPAASTVSRSVSDGGDDVGGGDGAGVGGGGKSSSFAHWLRRAGGPGRWPMGGERGVGVSHAPHGSHSTREMMMNQ